MARWPTTDEMIRIQFYANVIGGLLALVVMILLLLTGGF